MSEKERRERERNKEKLTLIKCNSFTQHPNENIRISMVNKEQSS